ncbi:hypothetical protein G7009_07795 [Pseudomonas capeferrum]|uniref:hypothetical protein n=1 Tax=Pseudomonas capeferrum TaxID=1495066 RepID=UPI0015E2A785|nr:hypothetical protein [Pseudomonas capeferrum]MBA1201662.1 hypothetical protein [Pseudomonas capeferrum]
MPSEHAHTHDWRIDGRSLMDLASERLTGTALFTLPANGQVSLHGEPCRIWLSPSSAPPRRVS